jgi:hypothetical protein
MLPAEGGGDADFEQADEKRDRLVLELEHSQDECDRARHGYVADDVPRQPAIEDLEDDAQAAQVDS